MSMHIETNDWKAFALVTEALTYIDRYKRSKELERLKLAEDSLSKAMERDPNYLRALYLSAMVNDLTGKANDAIPQFEKVLGEKPPFVEEVRYNLAVAKYHRYSWSYLDDAAELFKKVIENTKNDPSLNLLAGAGLAQTYAMRMIPKLPSEADESEIKRYYGLSGEQYRFVTETLENTTIEDEEILNEIRWSVHNARGMSLMYYTDYFEEKDEKVRLLKEGLGELLKADKHSPRNWANYCDLASTRMRLGHWGESARDFEGALNYLRTVIDELRPHYGFALYEMGRAYRLMGRFGKALEYLKEAEEIPYEYRDVGDKRIELEKGRALASNKDYP
jgi:tetratricopeptide (TPR) repeat protein